MKIAVACGGTGGHIFPGLATADVLRQRGHEVKLWLAGKDVETPALKDWPGPVVTVPAEGLPSGLSLRAIRASWKLLRAAWACRTIMRQDPPDVLLAMGSYASAGPVSAALSLKVPVVLHEANVLPGRAIALFSRWATAVAGSFEETRFYLRRKDLVVTGMPIRKELEEAAKTAAPHEPGRDLFTLLVMGGSRGAHKLNDVASAAVIQIHKAGHRIRVIHLTGTVDEAAIRKSYQDAGVNAEVSAFEQDMAPIYTRTDLAICRSGASTCAELSDFAVPALQIPYPDATHDHQMVNARAMEKSGAVDVVPERDLSLSWLVDYIIGCMQTPGRLARMSAATRSRAMQSAAESVASLVVKVGSGEYGRSV